ncbi:BTAD domain-containing putative transcriptional regulator [Actinomycetes bacterium KLBMP 9797]
MLFHVLGPLEVHDEVTVRRFGGSKPGALLATLLLKPNAWTSTGELIATTWPEQAVPASAEANLKTYVWRLRRELPDHDGGPRIESQPGAYRVRVAPGELDIHRVGELADEARLAAAGGDDAAAAALLERALRLWRGQPFAGIDAAASANALAHLEDLRLSLAERLGELQLTLGRPQEALLTLRAVTTDAPLREGAWAQLVRALHAAGRRAEAVSVYRRARELLAAELGVEPGPALAEAYWLACDSMPARTAGRHRTVADRKGHMTVDHLTVLRDRRPLAGSTRPRRPRTQQLVLSTHAEVAAALAAASRDVLIISTRCTAHGEPLGMLRRIDHENLRRGVRYRVLFPDRARTVPALALRLGSLALAGAEVRTVPDVPADATVVDETVAMLAAEPHDGRPAGVAVFRLPSVVNTIVELFDRVWPSAVSLMASDVPDSAGLTERERELLALLSVGCTDESAAARLGISVRTVRRMMSAIMNRLGARSRFQAGIKAADRGWLVPREVR